MIASASASICSLLNPPVHDLDALVGAGQLVVVVVKAPQVLLQPGRAAGLESLEERGAVRVLFGEQLVGDAFLERPLQPALGVEVLGVEVELMSPPATG